MPWRRRGAPGRRLCIAAVGSWIAGTFGVIMLTLIAPPLATFALRFGPPEYTALLVLGLVFLAYMSSTSLPRTLLMACLGLLLGTVGIDNMTGHFRYSFDIAELGDGIGIVPVAVGLFGLGEILSTPSANVVRNVIAPKLRELLPSRQEWRQSAMPIARGSLIGFLIGLTPGSAHIISSFLSYAVERRLSKHPEEFGKGAVAGVAGPELANNAASTGAFVPMLALGLPTGPITAVLIAALMIHGVSPGPTLVNEHPDIFWGFVASMYVGNVMLLALNLPLVGIFVNVLRIPYAYLYPLVIMFCVIGVYEVSHSIVDVWIMLIMGIVGYGLRKFGFDPAPLVLGLVIAPTFEMSLRQSLIMSNGNWTIFFQRPIALTLLAVCVGLWRSPPPPSCAAARTGAASSPRRKPVKAASAVFRSVGIGNRSGVLAFDAFSAANRFPPRIKSGAGFRRKALWPRAPPAAGPRMRLGGPRAHDASLTATASTSILNP